LFIIDYIVFVKLSKFKTEAFIHSLIYVKINLQNDEFLIFIGSNPQSLRYSKKNVEIFIKKFYNLE